MGWATGVMVGGAVALAGLAWLRARRIATTRMRAMDLMEDDQLLLSDPSVRSLGADAGPAPGSVGFLVLSRRELLFVARGGAGALRIPRERVVAVERDPGRLEVRFVGDGPGTERVARWELEHAEGWYRGLTAGPGVIRTPTSLPDPEAA